MDQIYRLVGELSRAMQGVENRASQSFGEAQGIFKGSRMAAKVRRVGRLDPNHIIVDLNTELSSFGELPPGAQNQNDNVLRAHLKHILEKRNGQW